MSLGLSDYVFQLGDTGVPLNTDSTGIPFVDLEKISGLDSAPYRETIRDHEGADGGFMDAEFEKGRDIILEGTIYTDGSAVEVFLDSLKFNYAPVQTPIPLYFKSTGVDERLIFVKPRGVRFDWEQARRIGMTNAQFLMFAEDPRIYTNNLLTQVINYGGDTGIGFAFNIGFNLDFGGGATPGGGTVAAGGNRPAPTEIIVTGPVVDPVITNTTTGDILRFVGVTLASSSETLTINTRDRTVYFNGSINYRSTLVDPDWFFLQVGNNLITYGAQSGTGSFLTFNYRSAWR